MRGPLRRAVLSAGRWTEVGNIGRYAKRLAPALSRIGSPLARVLNAVSARWGPLILDALRDRPSRFNELRRHLTGINHKVLVETLRMLERDGFVGRQVTCQTGQSVTYYRLTEIGEELLAWLDEVRQWAEACEHRSTVPQSGR